jgi:ketosteroid isomerase-like protein
MKKAAIALTIWLAVCPSLHPQDDKQAQRADCLNVCMLERPNPELQRQEVIALEKETVHAIQLGDATFFRRVYSDDFSGVFSRGENADKASFIAAVQAPEIQYESFTLSDTKVKLYRDTAMATGTWSIRAVLKGQHVSSQMRVLHIYLYTARGYRVVSSQATLMPPYLEQPL